MSYKDPQKKKEWNKQYQIENKEKIKKYHKKYGKQYRKLNKKKIKFSNKRYRIKNKEKIKEQRKRYKVINKEKIKITDKKYRIKNKDKIREQTKRYEQINKNEIRERKQKYYQINKDRIKEQRKRYGVINKDKINKYCKNRKKIDINFKLTCFLRKRLWVALKRNFKSGSAVRDLGCPIDYFKRYLESQFTKGMSWNNYGEWNIDHQVPLSIVDLTDRESLLHVCHYTNLQPMWFEDNMKKYNKITR